MRTGLVFLILALGASAFSQTFNYRVSAAGQEVGTATITDKITVAGNWFYSIRVSIKPGGGSLTLQGLEEFRLDGTPIRTISSMSAGGETESSTVIYSRQNATITTVVNGKKTKKVVAFPKGSIKSPSVSWFKKALPKVGTKTVFWTLNSGTAKWEQDFDKYVSHTKISVKGKMVSAHYVESKDMKTWFDSKGGALKMIIMAEGAELLLELI